MHCTEVLVGGNSSEERRIAQEELNHGFVAE
jgi:hypothetical protein